jgi:hypothetical protein
MPWKRRNIRLVLMNVIEEMEQLQKEGENLKKFNAKEGIKEVEKQKYEDWRVEFLKDNDLTLEEMETVNKVFSWLKERA